MKYVTLDALKVGKKSQMVVSKIVAKLGSSLMKTTISN